MASQRGLITTRVRALIAVLVTGLSAISSLYSALFAHAATILPMIPRNHPTRLFIAFSIVPAWLVACGMVKLLFMAQRKREKIMWLELF